MRNHRYVFLIIFLVVTLFFVILQRNKSHTTRSDAFQSVSRPTSTILPTPVISGDWNYDGVVNEQDEALTSH